VSDAESTEAKIQAILDRAMPPLGTLPVSNIGPTPAGTPEDRIAMLEGRAQLAFEALLLASREIDDLRKRLDG
jgi:hypothetical protein